MFALSWRITLVALALLPLFVFPARFWGRKLQAITRETFDLVAKMQHHMVERFNVSGALLAKLFGRPESDRDFFREKAARVSDIGVKQALYGRLFFTALMLVAALASALAYGWGGVLVVQRRRRGRREGNDAGGPVAALRRQAVDRLRCGVSHHGRPDGERCPRAGRA